MNGEPASSMEGRPSRKAGSAERKPSPLERSLYAAHGWEFLLDNHLEVERERREAVKHMAVLGEN